MDLPRNRLWVATGRLRPLFGVIRHGTERCRLASCVLPGQASARARNPARLCGPEQAILLGSSRGAVVPGSGACTLSCTVGIPVTTPPIESWRDFDTLVSVEPRIDGFWRKQRIQGRRTWKLKGCNEHEEGIGCRRHGVSRSIRGQGVKDKGILGPCARSKRGKAGSCGGACG